MALAYWRTGWSPTRIRNRASEGRGAHARIRTGDLFLTKEMLYRLSYVGGAALRFYLLDTDGQIHVRHRSGARQGKATAASSDACAGGRRTCPGCPARRHANLGAARTRR